MLSGLQSPAQLYRHQHQGHDFWSNILCLSQGSLPRVQGSFFKEFGTRNILIHSKPVVHNLFISWRKKPRPREANEAPNVVSKCQIWVYRRGHCPFFRQVLVFAVMLCRHVFTASSMTEAPKESRINFFFVFFSEPHGVTYSRWLTVISCLTRTPLTVVLRKSSLEAIFMVKDQRTIDRDDAHPQNQGRNGLPHLSSAPR